MNNLNILIVEGNLREENKNFSKVGIQTHTESLKESLNYFSKDLNFDVVNPSSDEDLESIKSKLPSYHGLIWGGSSLNIYNDTPEIRNQITFMKECQNKVKKILAICWGMQVAVTAAGGQVKKANASHIGIANEITVNDKGLKHPIYKNKKKIFNSPAFNFDEVVTLPKNAVCLASNKINKIQSLYFEVNNSKIWGLQYHPEINYEKMISLIEFRKGRLITSRKVFKDEKEIQDHISLIKKEIKVSNKEIRMLELKNWLNSINLD
ncbi:gamma-glutamyl-gamma-aminobutyrate hydrolase family protein [Pelagibacterales bacterium SAG-MED47]|nr:gamma-glutamyl-gamma-aminobutyrate hydrolase family protein [Pelagibacterales bacterium SAG-MED47]